MSIHYIYKITCLCGTFKDHYYIGKRSSKSFGYKSGCVMHKIIDKPFEPRNNENNIYNFIWKKAS